MRAHSLQPICSPIVLLIKLLGITLSSLCLISITTMLKFSIVLFFGITGIKLPNGKFLIAMFPKTVINFNLLLLIFPQCMGSPYAGAIMTQD